MDYENLGFKCGIEIHQQLNTETKLFCECTTEANIDAAEAKIRRFLRPVTSEIGDVDIAAQFEYLKNKEFVYNIYPKVSCLVEMDEEPPHTPKTESINTALTIALMLNCKIPDEIQWMRKTVIDGSNTSGFQRTSIVGLDGYLDTPEGKVGITDLELEEESAGIHGRGSGKAIYDLDRLGIPLIEIGTDTSIKNPRHAKEVALRLGMILRSTGKVKRGIGTIRQDVNVSIEEGARVEIKGFQTVKKIDILIEKEVERQKNLVKIKNELEDKDIEISEIKEVTSLLEDSDNSLIQNLIKSDNKFYAIKIENIGEGYMDRELCEGKWLGKELADYAKNHGVGGILHSDEAEDKGLGEEFEKIGENLNKGDRDLLVVVGGSEKNSKSAIKAVRDRINILPEKIPEETRDANSDFTTSYSRPLPGEARMYPETDVSPSPISEEKIKELKENLPETLEEKKDKIKRNIGEELADQIVSSPYLSLFERFSKESKLDDKDIANVFVNIIPDLETRENLNSDNLVSRHFKELFKALNRDKISKGSIGSVLDFFSKNPGEDVSEAISELGIEKADEKDVRSKVREVVEDKEEIVKEQKMHAKGALMGVLMKELKGKVSGSKLNELLKEEINRIIED